MVKEWVSAQERSDKEGNWYVAMSPAFACTGEGWQVGAIKGCNQGEIHLTCDLDHPGSWA